MEVKTQDEFLARKETPGAKSRQQQSKLGG
jgi:hypothetical protein